MSPEPFLIFFPPRLLTPDLSAGDHNAVIDDAVRRYTEMSIVLVDEEGTRNAQKIIAYAEAFPSIMEPPTE